MDAFEGPIPSEGSGIGRPGPWKLLWYTDALWSLERQFFHPPWSILCFLESILDSYFACYMQWGQQLPFALRKVRIFFFFKDWIPFLLPTPYPDLNNIPVLTHVCVHLCLPLIFHVPVTGPTFFLAKPFGEWSPRIHLSWARSLSLEVMLALAHWHFERLSQPSENSTTHLPPLLQYLPIFHSFQFLFYPLH